MFQLLIGVVVIFLVGLFLGAIMPKTASLSLGALVSLGLSYFFIYDNEYIRYSLSGSASTINTTMTVSTLFFALVAFGVLALGVGVAGRSKQGKEEEGEGTESTQKQED